MRKILLVLFGITTMFGLNKVYAAEIKLEYDTNIEDISSSISAIGSDKVQEQIKEIINIYNSDYFINYPYFYIWFYKNGISGALRISLIVFTEISNIWVDSFSFSDYSFSYDMPVGGSILELTYEYNSETDTFVDVSSPGVSVSVLFEINSENQRYNPYRYYYSNFDLYYKGSIFKDNYYDGSFLKLYDNLLIPTFEDSNLYSVHKADSDFLIEPYYLYDNNLDLKEETFATIDLNQYSYVALSLKDYSKTETFFTNVYVKGNYCITPVYNYGMTEKSEYYPGYQVDRCSPYYEDFTAVRTYILEQDLKNNAIYYLKAYDKTKDNVVKVDSSVFNITYITEEEKDNPYVSIGGKNYPTISYDNLNSSSTKSEEEGYISGVVCQVGDFNCYSEHNPSNIFDEIFSSPLKFLEDIWESVTSIFKLIAEFISLLPPIMQSFLYLSFMVAVILGLLKIIL